VLLGENLLQRQLETGQYIAAIEFTVNIEASVCFVKAVRLS